MNGNFIIGFCIEGLRTDYQSLNSMYPHVDRALLCSLPANFICYSRYGGPRQSVRD